MKKECIEAIDAWLRQASYYSYKVTELDRKIAEIDSDLNTGYIRAIDYERDRECW